jgi:HD-GYP domain-containing protein (c-di-GMP phosphodiesterase class II)
MKILLVGQADQIDQTQSLVQRIPSTIIEKVNDIDRALEVMTYQDDIDLVIIETSEIDQALSSLAQELRNARVAGILVTNREHEEHSLIHFMANYPSVLILRPEKKEEKLTDIIQNFVSVNKEGKANWYHPVPLERLKKSNSAYCDLYIGLNDKKYIRLLNSGDLYTASFLSKYEEKGVQYLFLKEEDLKKYTEGQILHIKSRLRSGDIKQVYEAQAEGLEIIHERMKKLGLDSEMIKGVDTLSAASMDFIESKEGDIFDLLQRNSENNAYLYRHSITISYIGAGICREMEWNTESTYQKIVMAALLHDMALEGEEFVGVCPDEFDNDMSLKWKQIKNIRNHSIEAAEIIKKSQNLPPDLDKIILAHHERPDGKGYPKGLNANNIFPLACVFIISEHFVSLIEGKEVNRSLINEILDEFDFVYNKGHFKAPLEGLKKLLRP